MTPRARRRRDGRRPRRRSPTAPGAERRAVACGEPGDREHRDVADRIERDDRRRHRRARLVLRPWWTCSPATTCALVTTRPGAATQPLPSWISSHARPLTLTVDARTRASTAGVIDVPGGGPGIRRRLQRAERRRVRRVGDRASPRREARRLARRPTFDRGDDRRAARHAGRPALRGRERRDHHPQQREHAERADRRAREPVPAGQRPAARQEPVHERRRARARPSARAMRREHEEQHGDRRPVLAAGRRRTR